MNQRSAGSGSESCGKRVSSCTEHNLKERNQNSNGGCIGLGHETGYEGHAEHDDNRREGKHRRCEGRDRVNETDLFNNRAHEQEADRCNQRGGD